jgi:hypothetical protein
VSEAPRCEVTEARPRSMAHLSLLRRKQPSVTSLACVGGGKDRQGADLSSATIICLICLLAVLHVQNSTQAGHHSRGDAGGTGPGALPGSITVSGRSLDQPTSLSCHSQRVHLATVASDRRRIGLNTRVWWVVPAPRHVVQRAADLGASHRALSAPVLSIEGVRTHAHATSTGAVPVFHAFQRRISAR